MTFVTRLANDPARLDREQRGSLRRMLHLADQLEGDWSGMQTRNAFQEDYGALRFQLAYMAYALALTHVHRLPAAPALFREPFARLIEKLRSPDVWAYWHYVGTGGSALNRQLGPMPAEWDPNLRDNIMYSGYLQSSALLFHHLFDDDRYARPGGLTLTVPALFWGGPEPFVYDERSLSDHIYWQMVENGYLGVACEPNCIFQICNQVPILGFRFEDLVHGSDRATEVAEGYRRAWADFGIVQPDGQFATLVRDAERDVFVDGSPWSDFWLGALMHAWEPELVARHYPAMVARWIRPGPGDTAWVDRSRTFADLGLPVSFDHGWAAVCATEVGDLALRDRLLAYADLKMRPRWERGALFYPRQDRMYDDEGLLIATDPHTGNALLGLSRLNVPGGLKALWDGAWTPAHKAAPAIVGLDGTVDFETARYDPQSRELRWIVHPPHGEPGGPVRFEVGRPPAGRATLTIDGEPISPGGPVRIAENDDGLSIALDIDRRTDLALAWA